MKERLLLYKILGLLLQSSHNYLTYETKMAINTTTPSILAMKTMRSVISHTSHNIANSDTEGFKKIKDALYSIEGDNGVSSIETYQISTKGASTYTGIATDLSLEGGNGMFAVIDKNDSSKKIYYAPTGSFRTNKEAQLEYLEKYLLVGQEYDMKTGKLIGGQGNVLSFKPITLGLDKTTAEAVASTEINTNFKLKADTLVSGQPQVLMQPKQDITSGQNIGIGLDDVIAPDIAALSYNSKLLLGSGFNVAISRLDGTKIVTQNISCEFGGIAYTGVMSSGTSNIRNIATDTLDIQYGDASTSIKASDIFAGNDLRSTDRLSARLQTLGFNTRVIKDSSGNNATLLISPPSADMKMSFSGALSGILGLSSQNVDAAQAGVHRFATMGDLSRILGPGFGSIVTDSSSTSMLLNGKMQNSISMTNNQTHDILSAFGISNSGTELDSGYDPYNSDRNIAGGAFAADIVQVVDVFDSQGYSHPINIALKKIDTNTWAMETYIADKTNIVDSTRNDGLIQATMLTFTTDGRLSTTKEFKQSIYSSGAKISNPLTNLNAANGQDIIINRQSFTYKATGVLGANEFRSMVDLVNAINNNISLKNDVKASIIKDKKEMYQLKLTPIEKGSPVDVGGNIPGVPNPPLGDGSKSQTILEALGGMQPITKVPDISQKITIKWSSTKGAADSNIKINYNENSFYQAVQPMLSDVTANGRAVVNLNGITISKSGDVVGNYTSGVNINLYRLPIATFKNINGLNPQGDNVYGQSYNSGVANYTFSGEEGTSISVSAGNLESSNVDVGEELTRMMLANQTYSASTKALQVGLSLIDILLAKMQ